MSNNDVTLKLSMTWTPKGSFEEILHVKNFTGTLSMKFEHFETFRAIYENNREKRKFRKNEKEIVFDVVAKIKETEMGMM